MKKKNGFVFVETMVVVVVLVSILLIIYSSYTSLISLERRQARYDDPLFIYRTHVIGEFLVSLKDDDGNSIIGNKLNEFETINSDDDLENDANFMVISPSDQDLFNESYINQNSLRQSFFSSMYNDFNVQTIILITSSKLKTLEEEKVSSDFYRYLKTIDTNKENQAYIAVMYAEKVNGEACDPNNLYNVQNLESPLLNNKKENTCTFYYANLKLELEE